MRYIYSRIKLHRMSLFALSTIASTFLLISCSCPKGWKRLSLNERAHQNVLIVSKGLEYYKSIHSNYPEFSTFESMVNNDSCLVKDNIIPANVPFKDPWGQPYEGISTKEKYILKCYGDPNAISSNAFELVSPKQ